MCIFYDNTKSKYDDLNLIFDIKLFELTSIQKAEKLPFSRKYGSISTEVLEIFKKIDTSLFLAI